MTSPGLGRTISVRAGGAPPWQPVDQIICSGPGEVLSIQIDVSGPRQIQGASLAFATLLLS